MYLLFDFDGTICDSLDFYLDSYNSFLTKHNRHTLTRAQFRELGVLGVAKREHISYLQLFWYILLARRMIRRHIRELKPFGGIASAIDNLSKKHKLGIVTSNSRQNVEIFLEEHKMREYFQFIESQVGYRGKAKKISQTLARNSISPNNCCYIGDETRDVLAAKEVGIQSVAVGWGFENQKKLRKSQPSLFITKVNDLYKSVSRLS